LWLWNETALGGTYALEESSSTPLAISVAMSLSQVNCLAGWETSEFPAPMLLRLLFPAVSTGRGLLRMNTFSRSFPIADDYSACF